MPEILDIAVPDLSTLVRESKVALDTEYSDLRRSDGSRVSAFRANNALFAFALVLARLQTTTVIRAREIGSQATPFGASGAALEQFVRAYGIAIPAATLAEGVVQITGESSTLATGSLLVAANGVEEFETTAVAVFGSPEETISVPVRATEAGSSHNLAAGDSLDILDVTATITPVATWEALSTAGIDPATEDDLAALLQDRLRQGSTPFGTAYYRAAARRALPTAGTIFLLEGGSGPGSINVFPTLALTDQQEASTPWLIQLPTQGQLDAVQASLSDPAVRGTNDRVFVLAATVTLSTFEVTIQPDTADLRAAVTTALGQRLLQDFSVAGYTIANSELNAAIGATQVTSHTLLDVNGQGAAADLTAARGEIISLGVVTFS